jgi:hypothetical protein
MNSRLAAFGVKWGIPSFWIGCMSIKDSFSPWNPGFFTFCVFLLVAPVIYALVVWKIAGAYPPPSPPRRQPPCPRRQPPPPPPYQPPPPPPPYQPQPSPLLDPLPVRSRSGYAPIPVNRELPMDRPHPWRTWEG